MSDYTITVKTEQLTEMQILHVEQAIDLSLPMQGVYAVEYAPGLMFVDPINNPPYIVQLPNTLLRFTYEPWNSGTAKLQARVEARIKFEKLKNAKASD